MRIAQRTVSRNYKASLNRVLAKRADSLRRSEDGLRFKELSEDVAAGARAMNTQEMRYAAIQQKNTAEELLKELDAGWGVMGSMDSTIQDVLEEMKSAAGVRTEEKLDAIQKKIGNLKEEYLQQLNTQYGGKYLFGGTNNKTAPFTVNEDDKLLFNGIEVSKIHKGPIVGTVGTTADDDLYANDSRYYNDGVNYYHNDGKFYYSKDTTSFDISSINVPMTADPDPGIGYAAANIDFTMDGEPIQIWNGTAWENYKSTALVASGTPLTVRGDQYAFMLNWDEKDHGIRIGTQVYDLAEENGVLKFSWKGTAATTAVPPTGLDTSGPQALLTGDLKISLKANPGTFQTTATNFTFDGVTETEGNFPVPYSDEIYLDTGLGLTVNRGAETTVDPRTAFQANVIGLELCGFTGFVNGIALDNGAYDQQTIANNIYDMISQVEKLLAPGYSEKELDAMQMQLTKMNDTMRMARTDVDTRANSIESMITRLKSEIDGMEKLEDSLMTADPANEAINLKDVEYSWQAVLALGSQILPSSLLDYLK